MIDLDARAAERAATLSNCDPTLFVDWLASELRVGAFERLLGRPAARAVLLLQVKITADGAPSSRAVFRGGVMTLKARSNQLRTHHWPIKKHSGAHRKSRGKQKLLGTWWTIARGLGQHRERDKASEAGARRRTHLGDPARFYLLPCTNLGFTWWHDGMSVAFDDERDLIEWLGQRLVCWERPK